MDAAAGNNSSAGGGAGLGAGLSALAGAFTSALGLGGGAGGAGGAAATDDSSDKQQAQPSKDLAADIPRKPVPIGTSPLEVGRTGAGGGARARVLPGSAQCAVLQGAVNGGWSQLV